MKILRNIKLKTPSNFDFLLDLYYVENYKPKPIIIFSHGFKGFKDWGCWDLIAKTFAKNGYIFIKYNFSHNGTTINNPMDFDNLEAFGKNTYSLELEDLETVINWITKDDNGVSKTEKNTNKICLIGHSRGGGTSIIKSGHNKNISALVTWASVGELDYSMKNNHTINKWIKDGVIYVYNGRTKQNMPLYISLYDDYQANLDNYNTLHTLNNLEIPMCIIHGTDDMAVPSETTNLIRHAKKDAEVNLIKEANHVFGGSHPYTMNILPKHSIQLINHTLVFLEKYFGSDFE